MGRERVTGLLILAFPGDDAAILVSSGVDGLSPLFLENQWVRPNTRFLEKLVGERKM